MKPFMRFLVLAVGAVGALGATACLRKTEFHCETSDQCGSGTCEVVGYCSFFDPGCESGARFSGAAGPYADQCVGGMSIDAAVDSPFDTPTDTPSDTPVDMPPDTPLPTGCPSPYATIQIGGVTSTHKYKLATPAAFWGDQQTACTLTSASAYLAIPDTVDEADALTLLAAGGAGDITFWVGISDEAMEGTFVTVKGDPSPVTVTGNAGNKNCVQAVKIGANPTTFEAEKCMTALVAVCECEG